MRRTLLLGALTPLLAAVLLQAGFSIVSQRRAMIKGLENKAGSLSSLMVNVVGPSVALDDPKAVQDGLAFVTEDPDFSYALTLGAAGQLMGYVGAPGERDARVADARAARSATATDGVGDTLMVATRPIWTAGKCVGTVCIALRTGIVKAQINAIAIRASLISLAGVIVGTLIVVLLAGQIARRNRDMRRVLDSVAQGFLSMNADGTLCPERSAMAVCWLGPARPGQTFWDAIAALNPGTASYFEMGWEAIAEDVLPLDLLLAQLPNRLASDGKTFRLEYRPVLHGRKLHQLSIVISDISAELARERAEATGRDLVRVIEHIARDRCGFVEFLAEGDQLVRTLAQSAYLRPASEGGESARVANAHEPVHPGASGPAPTETDEEKFRRDLHTLKGNAAIFGLTTVAEICHALETRLAEAQRMDAVKLLPLAAAWDEIKSKVSFLALHGSDDRIEIPRPVYTSLLRAVAAGTPSTEITRILQSWNWEPTDIRLYRAGEQVRALAQRLDKGEVSIVLESNDLRLPPTRWAAFWNTFTHVVRNAVDHGLETPAERSAASKSVAGTVVLRTLRCEHEFRVEIEDDGRGIDWDRVRAHAAALGLPHQTPKDLHQVLFVDGVTTKNAASELSGRGVGLGAARAECLRIGGRVTILSELGKGTLVRFSWPDSALQVFTESRAADTIFS